MKIRNGFKVTAKCMEYPLLRPFAEEFEGLKLPNSRKFIGLWSKKPGVFGKRETD
jgi:hypothetical protein